jgi:feruloyl esterase
MGAETPSFFRLFMEPGVFHGGGGVGPWNAEWLGAIQDWVEKGSAPDTMKATKVVQGRTEMTRPLCKYPEVAKYKGPGSPNEAESFSCVKP